MKNVTTYETSLALKQAGFPQPEPEAGQVWYNKQGDEILICKTSKLEIEEMDTLLSVGIMPELDAGLCLIAGSIVFAPTAADILLELGHRYELSFGDDSKWWASKDFGARSEKNYIHENPAEACAMAWLELKKTIAPIEKE